MKTVINGSVGAIALLMTLISLTTTSCEHKDLCYHHEHYSTFRVEYDWRDAPEADPVGMALYFYPEEGGEPLVFQFSSKNGGEITVPHGRYTLLTYNNDTNGVSFDGMGKAETHTAYTRNGGLFEPAGIPRAKVDSRFRAEGTEDERVVICPDEMWGCKAVNVEVNEQGMSYLCVPESEKDQWIGKSPVHTEYVVTLYPHELTCVYTYEIRNVVNLDQIGRMSASLSGMSPALQLLDCELDRECVTLPFEAVADTEGSRIVGRFITFGHHEENVEPHKMTLYVWTNDGKAYVYGTQDKHFDVTDQVHAAPDRRRVHIVIDGLKVPDPVPDQPTGGYDPGIDDMPEINFDIIL